MTAKKLFLYAAMAMILGAGTHHAIAATPASDKQLPDQPVPPLLDLKAEAKKQSNQGNEPSKEEAGGSKPTASETKQVPEVPSEKKKTETKHQESLHWSYQGTDGPEHWGELSPKYAKCKTGKNQSPINLMESKAIGTSGLAALDVVYRDSYLKIGHNVHSVQINYPLGSYIRLNGHRYELLHFNFHTPSEHQLNGFNYPMEMQLVHRDGEGHLAVIGIIFREGEENKALQGVLKHLSSAPVAQEKDKSSTKMKEQIFRDVTVNPKAFFPENKQFFKYSGSLTTPPCSEGVYWMVFKHPIEASYEQLQQMNEAMGENARPLQKLNARDLLKSWMDPSETGDEYEFYY